MFCKILFLHGKLIMIYCITEGNHLPLPFPAVQIKNCSGPGD